jgi:hypothetical protein
MAESLCCPNNSSGGGDDNTGGPEEPCEGNIMDVTDENEDFTTFVAAVTAAGLVDELSGEGPFTVFGTCAFTLGLFYSYTQTLYVTFSQPFFSTHIRCLYFTALLIITHH